MIVTFFFRNVSLRSVRFSRPYGFFPHSERYRPRLGPSLVVFCDFTENQARGEMGMTDTSLSYLGTCTVFLYELRMSALFAAVEPACCG